MTTPAAAGTDQPVDPGTGLLVSVILCTYNRAAMVGRTIEAVLTQDVEGLELVLVDDGSTDGTPALLDAIADPRVRVLHRENGGLCVARNSGLAHASGRWIVFLDDDDVPSAGWLGALVAPADDDTVGLSSVGARFVDDKGRETGGRSPDRLGPAFDDVPALYLPGTFAVRHDVVTAVGGYTAGLGASHQFELFLRLVGMAAELGLRSVIDPVARIDVYRRPPTDRPVVNPRLLHDGSRWVLERHPVRFGRDRALKADFEAIVGANAARLGDWRTARHYLARSVRSHPRSLQRLGRLGLALAPPLGRRVWGRQRGWATHCAGEIGVPRQRRLAEEGRELFLPWGYRENRPASSDAAGTPFWEKGVNSSDVRNQDPVYRVAARLARRRAMVPVVDVGCGTGHKLVHRIGAVTDRFVGADQPSAMAIARSKFPERRWVEGDIGDDGFWAELAAEEPGLVLCVDVIEHVDDPVALLLRLRALAGGSGRVLLSTPDRARMERSPILGPPTNPRHIREWTRDELELLALSTGFDVRRVWHLYPRRYSATVLDLKRVVWRALHLLPVPDSRSSMALLIAPTG